MLPENILPSEPSKSSSHSISTASSHHHGDDTHRSVESSRQVGGGPRLVPAAGPGAKDSPSLAVNDAPSSPHLSGANSNIPILVIDTNDVDAAVADQHVLSPSYERSSFNDLPNEIINQVLSKLLPAELSSFSLVSHRFNELATTRHAWRSAFTTHFSPIDSPRPLPSFLDAASNRYTQNNFTRLTAHASWRSEYTLRTRLLRALERGKPTFQDASPTSPRAPPSASPTPLNDYDSRLNNTVDTLQGNFRHAHVGKANLQCVHASSEDGRTSTSDPATGVVSAYSYRTHRQFADWMPGDALYGLGAGDVVGLPNSMVVSSLHGSVFGSGIPGHSDCWWTDPGQTRRTDLVHANILAEQGVPLLPSDRQVISSLWIAQTATIPKLSSELIGIMTGTSSGVVSSFSLGRIAFADAGSDDVSRTACWALSPGVPIVSIVVDEQYSQARSSAGRPWACVLNALGEVFVLSKFPERTSLARLYDTSFTTPTPWATGRSVYWDLLEPSRRMPRPDPYRDAQEAVLSPRSSWNGMDLSDEVVRDEVRSIEAYFAKPPRWFRKNYVGWDMQRRLEVDFAGSGDGGAAESIVVIDTGLAGEDGCSARIMRYTRFVPMAGDGGMTTSSTLGEWRSSRLTFEPLRGLRITTSALDESLHATTTVFEDPMLDRDASSGASTPLHSVGRVDDQVGTSADIPGRRGRYLAIGTKTGSVIIWDVRAGLSSASAGDGMVNKVGPIGIIHTDSPQITCIAVSALAVFHGGNDGLVQAWNPLGAGQQPVRTLNSRFSSRARRRLVQTEGLTPDGVGYNHFAAGAICIDPDPTILRGVVSIGTKLRYWRFSTHSADQYRSQKRRARRSERGSNSGGEHRAVPDSHGNVLKFMENERLALEADEARAQREAARLAGRYGTELLGEDASEEELMAYATLLSQESHAQEVESRQMTPAPRRNDVDVESDVAEAIRQSLALQDQQSASPAYPASSTDLAGSQAAAGADEAADLDLAIRLAMEDGQEVDSVDGFPELRSPLSVRARGKRPK